MSLRNLRPIAPRDSDFLVLPAPTIYDWSADRDSWVSIDKTVVRYALSELRKIERPQHPQAHAEAIASMNQALRP